MFSQQSKRKWYTQNDTRKEAKKGQKRSKKRGNLIETILLA
jgi:hypothetical protein